MKALKEKEDARTFDVFLGQSGDGKAKFWYHVSFLIDWIDMTGIKVPFIFGGSIMKT